MADHDFIAVTNHAWLLTDRIWEITKEVADEMTQDGTFVSFPAFEWTASSVCGTHYTPPRPDYPAWGHRNVYFRDSDAAPLLPCTDFDYDTPDELFEALPGIGAAVTIPHHTGNSTHPFDWSTINPDYDRLVEIIQRRGSYETDIVDNGWSKGQILGVVGGTDNHIAAAGWRGGITAILAPALTRDALFDALLNRHTYATTHADIILHFFADGEMQGSVLSPRSTVRLNGEVTSRSGEISLVELLADGAVLASWQPGQPTFRFERTLETDEAQHYFYLKVTVDNDHRAWSSPIWVSQQAPATTPVPTAVPQLSSQ